MTAVVPVVLRGDARALPLLDSSVDLIVTSPPYWGLRSYQDGGEHYAGQIGDESTPAEYVSNLLQCTAEWMRVLKPTGSLWINLGDSYYSGKGAPGRTTVDAKNEARTARRLGGNPLDGPSFGVGRKSLVGLPWRYALGCIDQLGLILRAELIWSKPNALPESVTDRVRRSHEHWFHLTKLPRYFSAIDEIREPHVRSWTAGRNGGLRPATAGTASQYDGLNQSQPHALGALPGSVWEIPTEPLKVPAELGVDHFAAFPTAWPRRIIRGWSPTGICIECGEGRRPVMHVQRTLDGEPNNELAAWAAPTAPKRMTSDGIGHRRFATDRHLLGYSCACPDQNAPTRPAVVLDPFGGTGTTALVASMLGRRGVTVDRSADYCRIAQWRTTDPGERARVLGLPKPKATPDVPSLFAEVEAEGGAA
ncbi:hypothetical protein GT755_12295 [Herbidospora sp. NEAU-GS84]|uniref:Methyltransferase n=1 Tax=Herbidospora solisilvae TaxID=2696284 RepID=A0A7C9J269_9ACTN|nr:site-specific DNA-methyltransferase [Herbidospora solisilvae]NAS22462.1 hypothetical protein [Herbidospora solisilvae]